MIDFASLLWFVAYGAAFLVIGLALRQVAKWSGGASFADPFGGYRDLPWPHGVQEEEPLPWDMTRLRRRGRDLSLMRQPECSPSTCAAQVLVRD